VRPWGQKPGRVCGECDGAVGAAGGGDISGVEIAGCCKHFFRCNSFSSLVTCKRAYMRLYLSDALRDMDLSGSRHARKRKHQHRELGRVGSGGRRVFAFFGSSPLGGTLMKRRHLSCWSTPLSACPSRVWECID
jgi:hypothetical protein